MSKPKHRPQSRRAEIQLKGQKVDTSDIEPAPFTELDTRKRAWSHLNRALYTNDLRPKVTASSTVGYHSKED